LVLSQSQRRAVQTITNGVNGRRGFVLLIGAAGLGKTTVLRTYLEQLDAQQYTTIPLCEPTLSLQELLARLCQPFGLTSDTEAFRAMAQPLRDSLYEVSLQGRYVVLMVDDAHTWSAQTLWNLHMLATLLQTPDGSLVQMVLAGQPALLQTLRLPELRALRVRITLRATLASLTRKESGAYIQQRLTQATSQPGAVFTSSALTQLVKMAHGNPQTLNTLGTAALHAGLAYRQKPITAGTIREVVATDEAPCRAPLLHWRWVRTGGLVCVLGLLVGWLYASQRLPFWKGLEPESLPPQAVQVSANQAVANGVQAVAPQLLPLFSPPNVTGQKEWAAGSEPSGPFSVTSPISSAQACLSPVAGAACTPEVASPKLNPATVHETQTPGTTDASPPLSNSVPLQGGTLTPPTTGPTSQKQFDEAELRGTRVVCVTPRAPGERGKDIILTDYRGGGMRRLVADGALNLAPSLSPDGTILAYTSYRDGTPAIYLRTLATGTERRLTSKSGFALPGAWSPNGRYLALTLSVEGNSELFLYDTARQQVRRLTTHNSIDVSPYFAPDSTRLVFTSDRSGSPQLHLTDIEGRVPVQITHTGQHNTAPVWSPHDETIAFIGRSPGGTQDVYTIRADGTHLQRLTNGRRLHKFLTWAPNGRFVLATSLQGAIYERHLVRADGQEQRMLPSTAPVCQSPQWIASHVH
jgi:type II secretory pathway predicted ATPase ExeA